MAHKQWYVHVCEQTIGPLSEAFLMQLLQRGRVQFADFAWSDGMEKWQRLADISHFAKYLPEFPKVPVPVKPEVAAKNNRSAPAPQLRAGHVPIFATVMLEGDSNHQVVSINENEMVLKPTKEIPLMGKETKFRMASMVFDEPFDMTGILVHEKMAGENAVVVEFTKLNPSHRRQIKAYVESALAKK